MLDIVRENSWKAGIEQKERMKERRLEKVRKALKKQQNKNNNNNRRRE